MTSSPQSILDRPIWFRALPLAARLENGPVVRPADDVQESAGRRLDRWRSSVPFLEPRSFERRLRRDGLDSDRLRALLAEPPESLARRSAEPSYLERLRQAWDGPGMNGDAPRGFGVSLAPLLGNARRRLRDRIQSCAERGGIDPVSVLASLEQQLGARLGEQMVRTMVLEMHVARLEDRLAGDSGAERFESFVRLLSSPARALSLLAEYPVLAASAVETADQWVDAGAELVERWSRDRARIETDLLRQPASRLETVRMGRGDYHGGGRSVAVLRLADGRRVVYKPRPVAVDGHFHALVEWLAERCSPLPRLRAPRVIDRGRYGWVEHVAARPCGRETDVDRFYFRQGSLLALLWLLGATDIHHENLIAVGDQPVLIDPETLLHPRLMPEDAGGAQRFLNGSVLSTGLLPLRLWKSGESEGVDLSALTSSPGQLTPQAVPQWSAAATDRMRLVRQRVEIPSADNRPSLAGKTVDPRRFRPQLLAGFDAMTRALFEQRSALAAVDGPLHVFAGDEVRVILRPTRSYAALLRESFHPDVLRDALDRDRLFDHLWVGLDQRPWLEPVIDAERRALWRGDVPSFRVRVTGRDLVADDGERFPDFLSETPLDGALGRLEQLGGARVRRQRWMVDAALSTLGTIQEGPRSDAGSLGEAGEAGEATGAQDRLRLMAAADRIAGRLERLAFQDRGRAGWLGLDVSDGESLSIGPTALDLYGGLPGIALFLAYHGKVRDHEPSRRLARRSFAAIIDETARARSRLRSVGAMNGWGGVLYACAHLAVVLRSEEALALALGLLGELPERIGADRVYDLIGGSAGLIGGLASLHAVAPHESRPIELAARAGEHLLASAIRVEGGRAWPRPDGGAPLTGFAHGSAGCGWGLDHAARICGDPRLRRAARAARRYERARFSPEEGNWLDLRGDPDGSRSGFRVYWCHGAPGIGIARLALLSERDDPETRAEIETAIATTIAHGFGHNHSLCHGDLGNLELLLAASRHPRIAASRRDLERIRGRVLAGIESRGPLCGVPLQVETPGLMVGLAGIGYQLLRLAEPGRVPSVLALEPPDVKAG